MAQFHQHPNGSIYVRSADGVYEETPENFAADHGAPPALPDGVLERLYDDGGRHALIDAKGNHVDTGPIPFDFGDAAIAAYSSLIGKKKTREDAAAAAAAEALAAAMPTAAPAASAPAAAPGGAPRVIA
jgi:hypothetical protein